MAKRVLALTSITNNQDYLIRFACRWLGLGRGDSHTVDDFQRTCVYLDSAVQFSYCAINERLKEDYELLDPARNHTRHVPNVSAVQERFLRVFNALVQRARFQPLTKDESALITSSHVRVSLPVSVDWSTIQSGMMARGGGDDVYGSGDKLPPHFSDKLLLFHRGVDRRVETGLYYSDKVDEVFSRLLVAVQRLFLRGVAYAGWVVRRGVYGVLPSPLLHSDVPPAAPVFPVPLYGPTTSSSLELDDRDVQALRDARVGLADLPLNLRQLLTSVELRDPLFKSVLLVYADAPTPPPAYDGVFRAWRGAHKRTRDRLETAVLTGRRVLWVATQLMHRWRGHRQRQRNEKDMATRVWEDKPFDFSGEDLDRYWEDSYHAFIQGGSGGGGSGEETVFSKSDALMLSTHTPFEDEYRDGLLPPHPLIELHDALKQRAVDPTAPLWYSSGPSSSPASSSSSSPSSSSLSSSSSSSTSGSSARTADSASAEAGSDSEPDTAHTVNLHIRELRDVPISEILLSFPSVSIKMKALDIARLVVLGSAGAGIVNQLMSSSSDVLSSTGLIALGSLGLIALRVYWRFSIAKTFCEHRVGQVSTSQAYSQDFATVANVTSDVASTEAGSAIFVYASLCAAKDGRPLSLDQINGACHAMAGDLATAHNVDPNIVRFRAEDGLDTLVRLGLAVPVSDSEGSTDAVPLFEAMSPTDGEAHMREVWGRMLSDDLMRRTGLDPHPHGGSQM